MVDWDCLDLKSLLEIPPYTRRSSGESSDDVMVVRVIPQYTQYTPRYFVSEIRIILGVSSENLTSINPDHDVIMNMLSH